MKAGRTSGCGALKVGTTRENPAGTLCNIKRSLLWREKLWVYGLKGSWSLKIHLFSVYMNEMSEKQGGRAHNHLLAPSSVLSLCSRDHCSVCTLTPEQRVPSSQNVNFSGRSFLAVEQT